MKKISILLISCLAVASAFLTSCDNDHYGPEPIDVTANYSNKLSNPNPNLILTYNGETMIGKSVDFSTVTGETAIINLYDILPGEKEVKIENESKYEKKNLYKNIGYIFSVISIVILTIVSAIDI